MCHLTAQQLFVSQILKCSVKKGQSHISSIFKISKTNQGLSQISFTSQNNYTRHPPLEAYM